MKKVFIGQVQRDRTNPQNFYLRTPDKPVNSQDIFGDFEGRKVKVIIEDIEESREALQAMEKYFAVKEPCLAGGAALR